MRERERERERERCVMKKKGQKQNRREDLRVWDLRERGNKEREVRTEDLHDS